MEILLEGKKEIIEKLKEKYPSESEWIEKMFNIDPTPQGKYSKWIGDYLSKSMQFRDYNDIERIIGNVVIPFEKNYSKIDDWVIKEFKRELGIMNRYDENKISKILKDPKDINSYPIPFYVLVMINILEEKISNKELEKRAKKNVIKIYENSKYLVLTPKTHEASCFYGRETRWCTASETNDSHFKTYSRDGVLYYFINKKDTKNKYALYVDRGGSKNVYNSADSEVTMNELYAEFEELSEIIDELTGNYPLDTLLKKYKNGDKVEHLIISQSKIKEIIPDDGDKGEDIIRIDFNGFEDFIKIIKLSESDMYLINQLESTYTDYDFYYGDVDADWDEGYIFNYFNESNKDLLRKIINIILPQYYDITFENDKENSDAAIKLSSLFESRVSNIIYDFKYEMNKCTEKGLKNEIESELCEYLNSYKIFKLTDSDCFELYETTVDNLISLFDEYKPKSKTIDGLIGVIYEDNYIGDWHENMYEYIDHNEFDGEKFNNSVEYELEKILDEIIDEHSNFQDYGEILDNISSKYKIGMWYKLPRKQNSSFRINLVDINTLSISVSIKDGETSEVKKYLVDNIDEFYSLIYNYKLFDDY